MNSFNMYANKFWVIFRSMTIYLKTSVHGERKECLNSRNSTQNSRAIVLLYFLEINAKTSLSAHDDIFMSPPIRLRKQIKPNEEKNEWSDFQATSHEFVHMLRAIKIISNDPQTHQRLQWTSETKLVALMHDLNEK